MNEEGLKTKLKFIANEKGKTFNQIWKQLLLERFLARLSASNHQEKFVFKGGLLLASYINLGRETTDIDFSLRNLHSEENNIENIINEVIKAKLKDDVNFKWNQIKKLSHLHMAYPGFQVSLHAQFGKMKDKIQIDIGVGDLVIPEEKNYPPFIYNGHPVFTGEITLLSYPIETIFSEKLESIISRGSFNSRMKDYHDLLLMMRESSTILDKKKLISSIKNTFSHRDTNLNLPISYDTLGFENLQKLWAKHLLGLGPYKAALKLPNTIKEVIQEVNEKLDFINVA